MKLKKLWKQANRGVILAIVLIIVMTCYVMIDKMIFNSEKQLIQETFEQYMDDYIKALPTDKDFVAGGAVWTDAAQKKEIEKLQTVINTYWTSTNYVTALQMYRMNSKSDILSNIQVAYSNPKETVGYVKASEYNVKEIKISKNGPNGAILSCKLRVKIDTIGTSNYIDLEGDIHQSTMYYPMSAEIKKPDTLALTAETEYNYNIELLRVNGEWKLAKVYSDGYSPNCYETTTEVK